MDKRSASIVDESSEPLSGTKQCVPVTQLKLKYSALPNSNPPETSHKPFH